MTDPATGVDPRVMEDLLALEPLCGTLGPAGLKGEFWETYALLRSAREELTAEVSRLRTPGESPKAHPRLVERLFLLREERGPLVRGLRGLLARNAPQLDSLKADLAVVLMIGSPEDCAAIARWLADPDGGAAASAPRIQAVAGAIEHYRNALLEARRNAAPSTVPATRSRGVSADLKPQFIRDLVLLRAVREALKSLEPALGWELDCVMLLEGDSQRPVYEELVRLKGSGKPGEFAGAAYNVRQRFKPLRAEAGDLVRDLRAYLGRIYGSWEGELDELSTAFLVSTEQGRGKAREWLKDPELRRGEATAMMNGLRVRAKAYLDAAFPPA
jgi:hypothetical protein